MLLSSYLTLPIIQLMNEFFQTASEEIGLFTFYKQQQDDGNTGNDPHRGKKGKKKRSKRKMRYRDYEQSLPEGEGKEIEEERKSKGCDQFLKSVRVRQGRKLALTEISEKDGGNSDEQNSGEVPFKPYQQPKAPLTPKPSPLISTKKTPIIKSSNQLIPQAQYFNDRHSLNSPLLVNKAKYKDRIIAQISHHLNKNKTDYIDPVQKDLIISRKADPKAKPKPPSSNLLPLKERVLSLQRSQQVKVASEREAMLKSQAGKELHEQNKRYFNNLMESLYIRPDCNQTVYRILRGTLKLPQVIRSQANLKTEHSSPMGKVQTRSRSFFKKQQCKIAVHGRLISQRRNK